MRRDGLKDVCTKFVPRIALGENCLAERTGAIAALFRVANLNCPSEEQGCFRGASSALLERCSSVLNVGSGTVTTGDGCDGVIDGSAIEVQ